MNIFRRALNLLDYRLVDHCERVAYIVFKMLEAEKIYREQELVKLCFLATLHDIGAYKTEEVDILTNINELISFEVANTLGHSAYGYLFVKKFSILTDYADAILFHHTRYDRLEELGCKNPALAAKIFLADRIDIMMTASSQHIIEDGLFSDLRDTVFCGEDIDLLVALEKQYGIEHQLKSGAYLDELFHLYSQYPLTENESASFLETLIYSIDFRSEFTVMHTITTVSISVEIAKLMGIGGITLQKIYYGALLHDIGKIATPTSILEKNDALTDEEFIIMKNHVSTSEYILRDYVDDEILQIAIRHHEKLDGSGYAHGLTGDLLNVNERIVCVADVLSALSGERSYKKSFSEEKIRDILKTMVKTNKLCDKVVAVVLDNYTNIMRFAAEDYHSTLEEYHSIHAEYEKIYMAMQGNDIKVFQ